MILASPPDLTADDVPMFVANSFFHLTESLRIEFLNYKKSKNIPSPIFNIFAMIPTWDPKTWHNICALLEKTQYLDPLNGVGRKGTLSQCQICQCVTHPRGLCPFSKINRWVGPNTNQVLLQRKNNVRHSHCN